MPTSTWTMHRARWLLGANGQLLENAVVVFSNQRIVAVERFSAAQHSMAHDWGDRLLTPLLVNAHTHLEFSNLTEPLGQPGMEFSQWIQLVLQWRFQNANHTSPPSNWRIGLEQSRRSGVGFLADIVSAPWSMEYRSEPVSSTTADDAAWRFPVVQPYLEQLGAKPTQAEERWESVTERLDQVSGPLPHRGDSQSPGLAPTIHAEIGLSPHAPYSTSSALFEKLVATARDRQRPLAMHVAESLAERELLEHGSGPFRQLLERLALWPGAAAFPQISQIIAGLASTGTPGLIVHGNYLTPSEMEQIARHRSTLSVVYCPRTHDYFEHQPYPLRQLLELGINVAAGTDSLASNPDLDLFSELQTIYRRHRDISPETIWQLGTVRAAKALGAASGWGQLAEGFTPTALCWDIAPGNSNQPLEFLLSQTDRPRREWVFPDGDGASIRALQK